MTTFPALSVIADIVVPPPTPRPRSALFDTALGMWPFVALAVVAITVLIFTRKSRRSNPTAVAPADQG